MIKVARETCRHFAKLKELKFLKYHWYLFYNFDIKSEKNYSNIFTVFNNFFVPILSVVTVFLIYKTFNVQKQELEIASKALVQSVEEMQNSIKQLEIANETSKITRLENIAFHLPIKFR